MPPKKRSVSVVGFGSSSPRAIVGEKTPPRRRSPPGRRQKSEAVAGGGPVVLSPLEESPIAAQAGSRTAAGRQHDDSAAPCVLEDLMALGDHHQQQQQQQQQHEQAQPRRDSDTAARGHIPRPASASRSRAVAAGTGGSGAPPPLRPISAASHRSSAGNIDSAASNLDSAASSGRNSARPALSPQNLAAASAAAATTAGTAGDSPVAGKQARRQSAQLKMQRSPRGRRSIGGRGSGALNPMSMMAAMGGSTAAVTAALLNEDAGGEEEVVYPLVSALHTARDQLHLAPRVIEWMREVLRWNVSANAHEANEKICQLVETVRLVTLELFRMADEIELLFDKAMTAWRTIPSGADSAGTARAHATFVDAHGRLRQVSSVFLRLVAKWQQGHAQLFDMVRPAAVGAQAPASFIFTCAASSGDDYVVRLNDNLELLETTAASFSSMIFQGASSSSSSGAGGGGSSKPGGDEASVPYLAQAQRGGAVTSLQRRGSVTDISGGGLDVSAAATAQQHQGNLSSASSASMQQQQQLARQSAEEFSVVRRPTSASALRRKFAFANMSHISVVASAAAGGESKNDASIAAEHDSSASFVPSRRRKNNSNATPDSSAVVSLGFQSEMTTALRDATQRSGGALQDDAAEAAMHELSTSQALLAAEFRRQRMEAEDAERQRRMEAELVAHFEARRGQSAVVVQRWWRRVLAKLRHGTAKSVADALFDEAVTFLSTTNQQRWTKRDTMLLHDIARRLHFLRCIRRIERFCSRVWIPKHFAAVKIQRCVRAWIWRKRDSEHRRRRKAAVQIQRWFHECMRRRARRKYLREKREAAIKARALRAARSAASAIRPPPPAERDETLVGRQMIDRRTGQGAAFFATLQPGANMCTMLFELHGGEEGHLWDDELLEHRRSKRANEHDDGDGHSDGDDGADLNVSALTEDEQLRRLRKSAGRPRSAAERFLVRPGHRVSSFTAKMIRFVPSDSSTRKKSPPTRPVSAATSLSRTDSSKPQQQKPQQQ